MDSTGELIDPVFMTQLYYLIIDYLDIELYDKLRKAENLEGVDYIIEIKTVANV